MNRTISSLISGILLFSHCPITVANNTISEQSSGFTSRDIRRKVEKAATPLVISRSDLEDKKTNLRNYLKRLEAFDFSGAVLVAERGSVVYQGAYGFSDKSNGIPFTANTVFNIASLTKPMTATAILILLNERKLNLNESIARFFDNIPEDKKRITIHQLLSHTSGLRSDIGGKNKNWSRDEVVKNILESKLVSKPAEKFSYSNAGYMLLAALIEKLSKKRFETYIEEKIFKPVNMTASGFTNQAKWDPKIVAGGFNDWKTIPSFLTWPKGWWHGSGDMASTLNDLYKWHVALRRNQLLSKTETQKLFEPYSKTGNGSSYGYGWYLNKNINGQSEILHGGDSAGYHIELRWNPGAERTIIVFTNKEIYDDSGFGLGIHKRVIADNITRIMDGGKISLPPYANSVSVKTLTQFEGTYSISGGGKFRVWLDGSGLKIGADGQGPVNHLLAASNEQRELFDLLNTHASAVVGAIASKDQDRLEKLLGKSNAGFFAQGWFEDWSNWTQEFGEFKSFEILGTINLPWNPELSRTSARLNFSTRSLDFHFTWNREDLYETITELDTPHAVVLPLAAVSQKKLAAYNLVTSTAAEICFEENSAGQISAILIRNGPDAVIKFTKETNTPTAEQNEKRGSEEGIEKIDEFLLAQETEGFGGVFLIAKDNKILLRKGYGFSDRDKKIRNTPETGFDIGSITKVFTAAAIYRLEMEGRLRAGDPLSKFFANIPADKAGITLEQLIQHTSGLPDIVDKDSNEVEYTVEYDYLPVSRHEIVDRAFRSKLKSTPGDQNTYSNLGYSLLGAVIELASGKTYEEFMYADIFKPMGMEKTGYLKPKWNNGVLSVGYKEGKEWGTPLSHPWLKDGPSWNLRANGGMISTVDDLYLWIKGLDGEMLLSKAAKKAYFESMGIIPNSRGVRTMGPAGSNGVFNAVYLWYLEEDRILIGLSNVDQFGAENYVGQIASRMRRLGL